MNLLQQYNNQKNSSRSYANGTIVSNDLENLISKYKEGTLSDNEKKLLMSQLQEISQTPLNTFESFQKDFYKTSISQGTDFYLNTGLETNKELSEYSGRNPLGQRYESYNQFFPRDIITEEDITKLKKGPNYQGFVMETDTKDREVQVFHDETDLIGPRNVRRNRYVTTEGEQLFYYNKSGDLVSVPDFGGDQNKKGEFLKKLAYNGIRVFDKTHVNIAGCGDNMTCITAGTNMTQNSIEAWNTAIGDENSPYYIEDKKQRKAAFINANTESMSAMSHLKFWGDLYSSSDQSRNAKLARQNQLFYEQAGFLQRSINRDDFFTETEGGDMILNPEAIVNFFDQEMQIGNIMGIHSGQGSGPGHAISYQGGLFYKGDRGNTPFDVTTLQGREHMMGYLQKQINDGVDPKDIMKNLQFLASNDYTEAGKLGSPYQYRTQEFGDMFASDDYKSTYGNMWYTNFQGNTDYQNYLKQLNKQDELYQTILTDLSGGESEFSRQSIDYQNIIQKTNRGFRGRRRMQEEDVNIEEDVEEEGLIDRGYNFLRNLVPGFIGEPEQEQGGIVPPSFKRGGTVGSGCPECDAKRLAQRMSPPSFHHGGEHDNSLIDLENNAYYNNWNQNIQNYATSISDLESKIQWNKDVRASLPRFNKKRKNLKKENKVLQAKLDDQIILSENEIKYRDKWVNDQTALYPVQLIVYPPGYSQMESGHIESRMLGNYNGNNINIDALGWLGNITVGQFDGDLSEEEIMALYKKSLDLDNPVTKATDIDGNVFYQSSTSVNSWYDGNREITYDPNDQIHYGDPNIRTAVLNLNHNQIQRYMNSAMDTNPTSGGLNQEAREGVGLGGIIAELSGEVSYDEDGTRIYTGNIPIGDAGYSFIGNNCGDATCRAFGINPNETDRILGTTTDPQEVFDYIINADQFNLIPGSLTGTKIQGVDEAGNYIDNREAYVAGGSELFSIPNYVLQDLLILEQKGFTLDKLSEGTLGDILKHTPNIGKELTENILNFNDRWYTAEWQEDMALDAIKAIKVSNVVDLLLDPSNTDRISGIANAIKTGDYSKIDAGDMIEFYINSTKTGEIYDDLGIIGDYLMWEKKVLADFAQNTFDVGKGVYDQAKRDINNIKLANEVFKNYSPVYKDIVEAPRNLYNYMFGLNQGTIEPYNPDVDVDYTNTNYRNLDMSNFTPNLCISGKCDPPPINKDYEWLSKELFEEEEKGPIQYQDNSNIPMGLQLSTEEREAIMKALTEGMKTGGFVNRSYQDGDEVIMDPKVMNQMDYRNMIQSTYSDLFKEDEFGTLTYYTPGKDYIEKGVLKNTVETYDNCIHGVCYTLNQILGDYSFLGDKDGFGEYVGNESFAENAAREGFIHRADYKTHGLNVGDILQSTRPRETSVDAMGEQLYLPREEGALINNLVLNVTDKLGLTNKEKTTEFIGNKYPSHAHVVLNKRVNSEGITEYLVAQNAGRDIMKARWESEQILLKELDNGDKFLNSYQGLDGMNKIKQDGLNKVHQIKGNNEYANLYNESVIPKYTVDDNTLFFSNDNTLDIFTDNYLEIGKMSNLPPHILNQLAINQLGIKEEETGSGSSRKAAKSVMNMLDNMHPGNLQKKMRERQYEDGLFFSGDDISWKEVLHKEGIINDKAIAQEILDYIGTFKSNYLPLTFDDIYGKSYKDIFPTFKREEGRVNLRLYDFISYLDRENKLNSFEQKHAFVNQEQSKGTYQQKNLSERGKHMRDLLFPGSDGFVGKDQQFISSLSLSIDNYHKIAKMYPDLNESELINLTTLMHNAPGKAMSRDYVMHFLKNNSVDYVNNVNNAVSNYNIDTEFPDDMETIYLDEVEITEKRSEPGVRSGFTLNPFSKEKKFLGLFEEGGEVVPSYHEGDEVHDHPHPYEDKGFSDILVDFGKSQMDKLGKGLEEYHKLKEEGVDAGEYFKGIDFNPFVKGTTMSFEGYRAYPINLKGEVEIRDANGNVDKTRTYLANNYLGSGWTKKAESTLSSIGDWYDRLGDIDWSGMGSSRFEPNEVEKNLGITKHDKVMWHSQSSQSMGSMK